jgi:hypothetical protein
MDKNLRIPKELPTRRKALIAGGAIVAGGAAAVVAARPGGKDTAFLKGLNLKGARALGDGFYEVDGWVLTAADIKRLGGKLPDAGK